MLNLGNTFSQLWDVVSPEKKKQAYQTSDKPKVSHAAQAEGLTPTRTRTLEGKISVLKANQDLFKGWGEVAGKGLEGLGKQNRSDLPAQIANEDVQVADAGQSTTQKAPEAKVWFDKNGRLQGDKTILQAFTTAAQTNETFEKGLGRDVSYRGNQDGRLTVQVNDPSAAMTGWGGGPHYKIGQGIVSTPAAKEGSDPDIISHESGHALLDSQRPQYSVKDSRTASAHEAFADGTALLVALQDKDVRADILAQRKAGQDSNVASTMAESLKASKEETEGPDRAGIRDASQQTEKSPEKDDEECHDSSRRFSHGLYQSVLAVEAKLRRENPKLSEDEALAQAASRVQADFVRGVDFLPSGNQVTQSDLAQAMIKADKVDQGGDLAGIYRKSFEKAQVPVVDSAENRQELKNKLLSLLPWTSASKDMKNSGDAVRSASGTQSQGIQAADKWLGKNAGMLGVKDQGLAAQRIYHNDKGETWVEFSDRQGSDEASTEQAMRVGFDASGRMIHADPDDNVKDEKEPGQD